MRRIFTSVVVTALATMGSVGVVAGPAAALKVDAVLKCEGTAMGITQGADDQVFGITTTAPASVAPGAPFAVSVTVDPQVLPASNDAPFVGTVALQYFRDFVLKFRVPTGATFSSASLSGGTPPNPSAGAASVALESGNVVLRAPGKFAGGSTFQFPTVTMNFLATGASGTQVKPDLYGTDTKTKPGYTFSIETDKVGVITTKCYPTTNPALSSTTIGVAPSFTSAAPPPATIGQPYSFTFTSSGSPAPTYSVDSGSLPDGLSLTPGGVLSGTPGTTGTSTFRAKASNGVAPDAVTGDIALSVNQAPAFTAASPPASADAGAPYSYSFAASGYPAPSFSVASGSLPDGLSLSSAGVLSGTPTAVGASTFTVRASNGILPDDVTPGLTVTVSTPANPLFADASPPASAEVGAAYSYTFTATGSPAPTFSVASGSLPPGLTLDTAGALSGTPSASGVYTFAVRAANGVAPDALTSEIAITVSEAPSFTAASPPLSAVVGQPYSYTFAASGFPAPTYSVATGSPPDGLSLSTVTGELSGTPITAGVSTFTVKAHNGVAPDALTSEIAITVSEAPSFTAASPPLSAVVGQPYAYTFAASGSPAPTFSAAPAGATAELPSGLAIDPASGELTWTPGASGPVTFSVTASNGIGDDAVAGPFTVTADEAPAFTAAEPPTEAVVGFAYPTYTFVATGHPAPTISFGTGSLPDGLTLTDGVLSGTPTTPGELGFTVVASNGVGSDATVPVTITVVAAAAPVFEVAEPPTEATIGYEYRYTFTASGAPAPTFSVVPAGETAELPGGFVIDPVTGELTWTPADFETVTFTVSAANGVGEPVEAGPFTIDASVPPTPAPYWPGWDIARSVVANPAGPGGWTLDGWGGATAWGGARPLSSGSYWPGWDIARNLSVDGSRTGYLLDGWGGLHPVGGAPAVTTGPYWRGWDIARSLALNPVGPGGWVLDGWGGIHAFGGAPTLHGSAYWKGWDIACDLVVTPDGTGGYVLDRWGGIHPVGGAAAPTGGSYWKGRDVARSIVLNPVGAGGWVLDAQGGIHPFSGASALNGGGYWPGLDIARSLSIHPDGTGYQLDAWGGIHEVGPAT